MDIQSSRQARVSGRIEAGRGLRPIPLFILILVAACSLFLWACLEEGEPVDHAEQVNHTYEAKEKHVLRAIAQVFNEKDLGRATIHEDAHEVTSDYVVRGEWRTRSFARVRQINWKECEVKLTVMTEKKTSTGWELRRLLGQDQYKKIFKSIESQIYREMYKTD